MPDGQFKFTPLRHERVVSSTMLNIVKPKKLIQPMRALADLCHVKRVDQIGKNGPVYASMSSSENAKDNELHSFEALFGRDSIIVAQKTLDFFPELAKTTIFELARLQGIAFVKNSGEEPGRIMHEYRFANSLYGKRLIREIGWQFPYYESVDATPLYIILVCSYVQRYGYDILKHSYTGRDGRDQTIFDSIFAAVDWIRTRMSTNSEGLIESLRSNPRGIENQTWKDSVDAYYHADGTLANTKRGVASIEIQAYAYEALTLVAQLMPELDDAKITGFEHTIKSVELGIRASTLKRAITDHMFIDKGADSFFAIGTDRNDSDALRPLAIRTSNPGHLLDTQLFHGTNALSFAYEAVIVQSLFREDMLSTSGIRTVSTKEKRYRPGAYQNGSVWPWENHKIACGLRNLGYTKLADLLEKKLENIFDTLNIYPEYVRGENSKTPSITRWVIEVYDMQLKSTRMIEQPPQEIQAWTVASAVEMQLRNPKSKSYLPVITPKKLDKRLDLEETILQSHRHRTN